MRYFFFFFFDVFFLIFSCVVYRRVIVFRVCNVITNNGHATLLRFIEVKNKVIRLGVPLFSMCELSSDGYCSRKAPLRRILVYL